VKSFFIATNSVNCSTKSTLAKKQRLKQVVINSSLHILPNVNHVRSTCAIQMSSIVT